MYDHSAIASWAAYLDWEGSMPDAMRLMELDGYMTGLAVTPSFRPDVVVPWPWRAEVWGTSGAVPFYDEAHRQAVCDGLQLYYADMLAAVSLDPGVYAPLCMPVDGEPDIQEVRTWASGFMLGIECDPDYWLPLYEDEAIGLLMSPITMFFPDADGRYSEPSTDRERDAVPILASSIRHAVCGLWKISGQRAPRRAAAHLKVGRNDPCLCGSGRKYKLCCSR